MNNLLNSSYDNMVFSNGDEVCTNSRGSDNYALNSNSDSYIRNTAINTRSEVWNIRKFDRWLYSTTVLDYTRLLLCWPMIYKKKAAALQSYLPLGTITASGDYTATIAGISGGGSTYFDTRINPSTDISDINNFSIFISCTEGGTDGGIDFGCLTAGPSALCAVYIQDSGNFLAAVGTATDSYTNANIRGIYCVNVRGGNIYLYKDGVESGSGGVAVVGALPNLNADLGSVNAAGSHGSFSDKTYNHLSIYNGALTEDEVLHVSFRIEVLQTNFLRGNAIT